MEIYSNRVFGYLNKYSRSTYLLLFELDLSNLICKLISHKKLDFDGNQIIMDQRDNRKFALLSGHGRQIAMVGDVNNDEIHIEDYKLEFGLNHCCPKLADDIFYGIRIRGQGNRTSFQHWQLDSGVTTVSSDKFMFQRGENIDPSRFKVRFRIGTIKSLIFSVLSICLGRQKSLLCKYTGWTSRI